MRGLNTTDTAFFDAVGNTDITPLMIFKNPQGHPNLEYPSLCFLWGGVDTIYIAARSIELFVFNGVVGYWLGLGDRGGCIIPSPQRHSGRFHVFLIEIPRDSASFRKIPHLPRDSTSFKKDSTSFSVVQGGQDMESGPTILLPRFARALFAPTALNDYAYDRGEGDAFRDVRQARSRARNRHS